MKKFVFICIALFSVVHCFAQDTVERKNRLSDSVIERFCVLKSDPEIKQGLYRAFFRRKTLLAIGYYAKNVKVGIWHFYNTRGRLIERYNYDTNIFLFEGYLDKGDDLSFLFDVKPAKTDTLTRPLKVGGSYYGFIPYVNLFQMPFGVFDIDTDQIDATIELLVTPLGRLADYKVHVTSGYYQYDHTFSLDINLLNQADRMFAPATLNHQPILSRIFIKCYVNSIGGLDFY